MRVRLSRIAAGKRPLLPPEIYVSHVHALFEGFGAFAIGVVGTSATLFVAGYSSGRTELTGLAAVVLGLGLIRLATVAHFAKVRNSLDEASLRQWERWYIVGSTSFLGLLGLANLDTFGFGNDAFARLATLVVTMAYLVGTPGRSFASPRLVNAQIVAVSVPLLLGLALAGELYWSLSILILIPFFLALKSISTRLNGIFMAAITRSIELGGLATRFDTALNNMPQGLVMFDRKQHITVVNARFREMLDTMPDELREGSTLEDLTAVWRKAEPADVLSSFLDQDTSHAQEIVSRMRDGRSISVRLQPMTAGGGVLLLEDITERVRTQAEINHLARYDSLTGMLNRNAFRTVAKELCARTDARTALLFVDLDRFKAVNDTLGHLVGDHLIVEVADRLRLAAGPKAVLGRFGGDEFVVYCAFPDGQAEAERLANAIIVALSKPYVIDGQRVTVGASIGIAFAQDATEEVDNLLRDADLALYRAKIEGRGTFRTFEEDMKVKADRRRRTEEDLRLALGRGELELHYQPIFNVAENRFVTCEALVRWRHPERGLVPPSEFIPIAEETGLIQDIGTWVLRQACTECQAWPHDMSVAVNLSAVQLQRGDVTAVVRNVLSETGLPPNRLEIEVTESLLLNDLAATTLLLKQMAAMGVKLSLDDFGTGFSSLSYLQSLPFTKVKIDRSFLQGLDRDSRAMVLLRGIQRLSADLGMAVVMEGVETPEQMTLVIEVAKVDLIQGFLMARPMPSADLRRLLAATPDRAVA